MEIYTVTCFGHRDFSNHNKCEKILEYIVKDLIRKKEYVEFLVGRNGEFDIFFSSVVFRAKKELFDANSSLTLVLPYMTAEYRNNKSYFENYYDNIEISEKASSAYFKSAINERNFEMIDRADLVICYIEKKKGGAYQSIKYARKKGVKTLNLAEFDNDDEIKVFL